jgi:hypothetical protein
VDDVVVRRQVQALGADSDMRSLRGGDMEVEVGEPALGARQEEEVEEREDRLNDVRKR